MDDFAFETRFACTGCGACCRWEGQVLLTDRDIHRLAAHLGTSEDDLIRDVTRLARDRRRLALTDQSDGACVFLRDNRCAVYPARPDQCRRFPFPDTTLEECPGLTIELVRGASSENA